ncbi:DUF4430 domain-containing protein [Rossellomorea vietnamensis]|uniref:DUF4430 domain-containing protein n=1 Tax=Rossellomorea vietnamensis TaxID=218284 RepID=A0A5D4NWK0_9BACI|nr:DUF4430 domain-containing protein [Rossellomorea vietnamensis]TYS17696.1 DUF4430 domain-containing protein [Rossellomorea vietnamensis]
MKRLIIAALMLLLLVLAGCAKDEVGAPGENASGQQSEETAEKEAFDDPIAEKEETDTEKEASIDDGENDSKATEEASEKESSNESVQENSTTTNTPAKPEPSEQSAEKKQAEPARSESSEAKNPKEETSSSSSQKKEEEKPVKQEEKTSPPKQEEKTPPPKQEPPKQPEKPKQTVTITIAAPDVKGTILPVTAVEISEGDTVLSVTQKITKAKGIQLSVSGSNATAYVEGIDNLFEMDQGPLSGWEVSVDGKKLDRSTGIYGVTPGQAIKWHYTKNYTE